MRAALLVAVSCALGAQELHPSKTFRGEISSGGSRTFTIQLKSGEYARVVVWKPRLPPVLRLRSPNGQPLIELNLPGSPKKAEPLARIADSAGEYRMELTAPGPAGDRDEYGIKLDRPHLPGPADQKSVAAQTSYGVGRAFESKRDIIHAVEEWEKALTLYRDSGDR